MIKAYVGLLGEGKTLSMVNDAIPYLLDNRRIFTNTPFFTKKTSYNSFFNAWFERKPINEELRPFFLSNTQEFLDAFLEEDDALFCIDEAGLIFNNRAWKTLDPTYLIKFAQSRKHGLDIFYTTQHFQNVEKRLRDITNIVVECQYRHMLNFPLFPKKIYNFYFNPIAFYFPIPTWDLKEKYLIMEKSIGGLKLKKLFRSFDTMYKIKTKEQIIPEKFSPQKYERL